MRSSYVTVTDQFCGAGGSSLGAVKAGAEIKLAMNHWKLAIETHNSNFPNTDHACTDIQACDPKRYPTTDILITSPECTNHSLAKGKKRKNQNQSAMFDAPLPVEAEERSRATMWDVVRFADEHDYRIIIVENVVDARLWRLWKPWMDTMLALEYECQVVYLNSMFAHPTPQSRDRMYCVFWKKGNRAPDLDIRPKAFCTKCLKDAGAVQSWKNPNKKYGKYKQQYVYLCPDCATKVEPYYYAAANAIDWSLPIQRIGDRKKPLKDKTMARIKAGLEKFGRPLMTGLGATNHDRDYSLENSFPTLTGTPGLGLSVPGFLVETAHSHSSENRFRSAEEALPTQSGQQSQGLATFPFIVNTTQRNQDSGFVRDLREAGFTQTTGQTMGVVAPPFILEHIHEYRPSSIQEALSTVVAAGNHHSLITPPWIMGNYTPGTHRSLTDAIGTITTQDHNSLVVPPAFLSSYYGTDENRDVTDTIGTVTTVDRHALVTPPFIYAYYNRNGEGQPPQPVTDPVGTQTAFPHHYLVQPGQDIKVEDCGFRMLQPHEIGRAMAFPDDYKVLGNSREKVKQYGNAVTPPVMQLLLERCLETLG